MFNIFKQKKPEPTNKLFRITLRIGRGSSTEMPENLIGAYVPIFVGAVDHESAAMKAVSSITMRGFEFIDIADDLIHELDPNKWESFVSETWPEFSSYFPAQNKVIQELDSNFIFTGPFASYEAS